MLITFGGGSFKYGVAALETWSLVTVLLAGCASPSWMWLGLSTPCAGVMLSPWELPAPLLWFRPYCPGTAFQRNWVCGRAVAHVRLNIPTDSQPARFTRWRKIGYLFRFFSPCEWIEACVRVSVALCHIVSSGGWRRSWCASPLQRYALWLPLYPYSVFQVLGNNAVVPLVAAGNKF